MRARRVVAPSWTLQEGDTPLIATALHAGSELREEVAARLAVDAATRLREEDPYTDSLALGFETHVILHRSRFEVDMNRPREGSVYLHPEDAWGIEVWRGPPDPAIVARSLELYDRFHDELDALIGRVIERHGHFVIYDLHSYNHRRRGPGADPADRASNPEVNVGTGALDRARWGAVVDAFIEAMREFTPSGWRGEADDGGLDVRENVKFEGGHFSQWIADRYGEFGCVLAIELKKTFIDEWSARLDAGRLASLAAALRGTVDPVIDALVTAPHTASAGRR